MVGDGYNFTQLKKRILALSDAKDWETARKEWSLVGVYDADEPDTCQCGHYPIVEICQIRNRVTTVSTEVGNRCVKRFLGLRSDLIFTALKRIKRDSTKSLNADALAFFRERKLLTAWEYEFSQDTMRMRALSAAQQRTRININLKVLSAVRRRGFQGPD